LLQPRSSKVASIFWAIFLRLGSSVFHRASSYFRQPSLQGPQPNRVVLAETLLTQIYPQRGRRRQYVGVVQNLEQVRLLLVYCLEQCRHGFLVYICRVDTLVRNASAIKPIFL
jgi:hypothetical protein